MGTLIRIVCFLAFAFAAHGADVISADRKVTWEGYVGTEGGIPFREVDSVLTGIDNTGATDVASAIQTALDNAASLGAVVLPAGTYKIGSTIAIPGGKVLRGSGMDETVLVGTTGVEPMIEFYRFSSWGTDRIFASDVSKGDTQVTFTTTPTDIGVGAKMLLVEDNEPGVVVSGIEGSGGPRAKAQWVKVTAIDGATFTFEPPSMTDWRTSLNARMEYPVLPSSAPSYAINMRARSGVEDLTLRNTNANADATVEFRFARECWLKNVKCEDAGACHVWFFNSYRCEIFDCWFDGILDPKTSSRGYAIQLGTPNGADTNSSTSGLLIHNSIFENYRGGIIIGYGSSYNVFAYNYFGLDDSEEPVFQRNAFSFHSSHPTMNLIEGNITLGRGVNADMYHGNQHRNTIHKNWLRGYNGRGDRPIICINLDFQNRYYNVTGNILGYDGIVADVEALTDPAGAVFYEKATPDTGVGYQNVLKIFLLGYYGEGGGTTETDTQVEATLIRKGNYNYVDAAIPASEALGGDTYPDSYYLSAEPDWWGNYEFTGTWPPFDATSPGSESINSIPAGARFLGEIGPQLGSSYTGRLRFNGTGSQPVLTDGTGSVPIKTN